MLEIVVGTLAVLIVISVIGNAIYRNIKGLPPKECACCKNKMKRAMKAIRRDLAREKSLN